MSRADLERHDGFEQVSPEVGVLDEEAFSRKLASDPDEALTMLADLVAATDPTLSALARSLAGRIFVDVASRVGPVSRGIGRMVTQRDAESMAEIDVDASVDALVAHRVTGVLEHDELRHRTWTKNTHALSLVVDRSGSMGGAPLATAALATAAVAHRRPADYSVLVFGGQVGVAKGQEADVPTERLVNSVLSLRGFGTTNLSEALVESARQLEMSRAQRKIVVLLSDCRSTSAISAEEVARGLDELVVISHVDDADEARAFATRVGARYATVSGPSDIPTALFEVLG